MSMTGCGGVVLCGGRSRRMGISKGMLPFGDESMLLRVVRLLSEAAEPIVVVAAIGQELPPLPESILIVRDEREARGPLEGLRVGLAALSGLVPRAFAASCDVPLLQPGFVRRMIELAERENWPIVVPRSEGYCHPLAAVYSVDVLPAIQRLLDAERLRTMDLFDEVRTRIVEADELRGADPGLQSLRNVNRPEDYLAALADAGLAADANVVRKWKAVDQVGGN